MTSRRWGQNHPHRGEQEVQAVRELELSREKGRSSTIPSLVEGALDDESDSDDGSGDNTWLGDDAKVKHDMVVKVGTGKKQSGFLKLNKSKSEPVDILVEAVEDYEEDVPDKEEVPIKCVSTVMNYQINCGIQFVDFDGRTWRHEADCITEAAENDLGEALRSPK